MKLIKRDNGAVSAPSGVSATLLGVGIAALVAAGVISLFIFLQIRKTRRLRLRLEQEKKLAKVGKPVLQRAPGHVLETAVDMSKMTPEMKQYFAQRTFKTVPPSQAYRDPARQWNMAQSSSSSGSNTSGPVPPSSSGPSSTGQSSSTYHSLAESQSRGPGERRREMDTVTEGQRPSFAREKRVTRVAVPSALLRGLADLPQLPVPGSKSAPHDPAAKVEDDGSLTPILDLDLELIGSAGFEEAQNRSSPPTSGKRRLSKERTAVPQEAVANSAPHTGSQPIYSPQRRMTGGPSPITVDYFSRTSRRNLAPAKSDAIEGASSSRPSPSNHRPKASTSSISASPHKKPDLALPPLPTATKQSKNQSDSPSSFRPLSLGFSLQSGSKSSSLNVAAMFDDMSSLFGLDGARTADISRGNETATVRTSSSKGTSLLNGSEKSQRKGSEDSTSATTIEEESQLEYMFGKNEAKVSQQIGTVRTAERAVFSSAVKSTPREKPTVLFPRNAKLLPFMTPHHHAVFPDQVDQRSVDRNSGSLTPDLSQIHEAPLPPVGLPPVTTCNIGTPVTAAGKASFASSLRARAAKMSLSRSRAASPSLAGSASPSARSSTHQPLRPESFAASSKSPADTLNSYGPAMETWKVSTEESAPDFLTAAPSPAAPPALGLGLSDENGKAMDEQMANSSLDHKGPSQALSPILGEMMWERDASRGRMSSSKMSRYSNRNSFVENVLGTPPMQQMASPQFGTLSTLSPKVAHAATMIGSDWSINRNRTHAHKRSIASSVCDTISTCMSENQSTYDGDNAQVQRNKLLLTIQQSKKARQRVSQVGKESASQSGFKSHSARVSVTGNALQLQLQSPPPAARNSIALVSPSDKKPRQLTNDVPAQSDKLGDPLHSAPLTPPLTPASTRSPMGITKPLTLLPSVNPIVAQTPSAEEQRAARMAKLRPLSLAVQQQQQHPQQQCSILSSSSRFKGSSGSISLHKSQYSSQSSSSNMSTTTGPSTSSSNTSLFQVHSNAAASPGRISFQTSSPGRNAFKGKARMSGAGVPLGVLPGLPVDASPSFLPSLSTPRITPSSAAGGASPSSHSGLMANWDVTGGNTAAAITSPSMSRFYRMSVQSASIPYHSTLPIANGRPSQS